MDDAVIAIEMMVVKMEEGYDRIKASAYAWSHTAAPMLAGTLVTAVGFMPNGFAQSTAGEYTSNMFWIVGVALIASWVVAVVFTPYLGVKMLPDIKTVEGGHDAIYNTRRYNRFRQLLTRVIARKWLVAGSVVAIFTVAVLGMAPELPDPSFAKIVILTDSQEAREALKFRLRQAAADGLVPEARVRVTQLVFGPYSPYPVAFRVTGPDPTVLRDIADKVKMLMQTSPLMRTVNTDWGSRVPTLHFTLNQDRLQAVGLTSNAVAQQLQFLLSGVPY